MVKIVLKTLKQYFLGGLLNKNPPANAREANSIPGPGGFHMPWSNQARAQQPLSLCSRLRLRATNIEPVCCNY